MNLTPEDIADLLPPNLNADDSRSRLLCVLETLLEFTDKNHGLTAKELQEVLRLRSRDQKAPSETSVLADIKAIIEHGSPAIKIFRPSRGQAGGFKCEKAYLTESQIMLLTSIVRTCKFISIEDCRDLCEGLAGLLSPYAQDRVVGDVFVDERPRPSAPDVYTAADRASEAIRGEKKISFEYIYYGLDGDAHRMTTPGGVSVFVETPLSLIFSNGNYYLETWADVDDKEGASGLLRTRRLDRMKNVVVTEEDAAESPMIENLKATVRDRTIETFDMLGDGVSRCLFLRVNSRASNYVFTRFGHKSVFENIIRDENGEEFGFIKVSVQLSPTFYRWLLGMAKDIKITKPKSELWFKGGSWSLTSRNEKTYEEALEDYDVAVQGYLAFLKEAASIYEEG